MIARIFFVLYLIAAVCAFALAVGLWARGADAVAWQGWAVVTGLSVARAIAWGDRA